MDKTLWAVVPDAGADSLALTAKTAELSAEQGAVCRVWLAGPACGAEDTAALAGAGAERVCFLPVRTSDVNRERAVGAALAAAAREEQPEAILFLGSVFFSAVAPAVAAMLDTGITADCTDLAWAGDGALLQRRPTFGGRKLATIRTRTRPVIATVRRGVFPAGENGFRPAALCVRRELPRLPDFCRVLGRQSAAPSADLRGARVLLAGGLGLGGRENFGRLFRLAEAVGGEVAASRGAVAAGYASFDRQVGQTGVTVAPDLYVAFGISGAVQHLSGMLDSARIVAVNPDRDAPIHSVSDYSIYGDCNQVISGLLAVFGKQ